CALGRIRIVLAMNITSTNTMDVQNITSTNTIDYLLLLTTPPPPQVQHLQKAL
ncbi:2194_t:CDS:2, partial [Cetraspora pellucida]